MIFLKACSHCAPTAPSTTRWSQAMVQLMMVAIATWPFFTTGRCSPAPTARMPPCGGLITAAKSLMPYMPRLEIEKVPPWNSVSLSLPERARAARSFISAAMVPTPFCSACLMIGVMSPSSSATAMAMSAVFQRKIEMRDRRLRLLHALGDDAAHAGERHFLVGRVAREGQDLVLAVAWQ